MPSKVKTVARANFFHNGMPEQIFEFRMPGQHHREQIALLTHQFHQALQFIQRFPVEVVRFID
jgi:hypothetical protein